MLVFILECNLRDASYVIAPCRACGARILELARLGRQYRLIETRTNIACGSIGVHGSKCYPGT